MLVNAKNGISSHELGWALGVHQETAWHMLGRIRLAMELGSFETLKGEIEADETYVGLRANMHRDRREKFGGKRGVQGKIPVMGFKQRNGRVVAKVVPNVKRPTLQAEIRSRVEKGSSIYSDRLFIYTGLEDDYDHQIIDHARSYVEGRVSTNQIENFWSLLKRALKGTYISVQPEHLQRYVTEEVCRFNARAAGDGRRFAIVLRQTAGKRLTYRDLAAKGSR